MRRLLPALAVLLLAACQPAPRITSAQVVQAFVDAGLEVGDSHPMTKDDYGFAPYLGEGTRFLVPSLCEDCGGRVLVLDNREDVASVEAYYVSLGEGSAAFYSWVFTNDYILVQINGNMPEEQARQYETVLLNLEK